MTLILGIETSCDETAASVVADGQQVRSNIIASQHDLHRMYHGVVPEIASRAHLERLLPVIERALTQAHTTLDQIDAVAVGHRPGLIGSLMVGVSAAKTIAWACGIPLIGIDHVRAHLYAAVLDDDPTVTHPKPDDPSGPNGSIVAPVGPAQSPSPKPRYPALGLVVSGGHTNLYLLDSPTRMRLLGRTIDDAVGEAYDKAAVILQLGYPGGPHLDRLAQQGDPTQTQLPRTLLGKTSLDFSFSGLKTALLYTVRGKPRGRGPGTVFQKSADDLTDAQRADLAASFQAAAVDTLMIKLDRAIDQCTKQGQPVQSVIVGGGVSANSLLRQRVAALGQERAMPCHNPAMGFCLDNAAMIAGLAYHHWQQQAFDDLNLEVVATAHI